MPTITDWNPIIVGGLTLLGTISGALINSWVTSRGKQGDTQVTRETNAITEADKLRQAVRDLEDENDRLRTRLRRLLRNEDYEHDDPPPRRSQGGRPRRGG